MTNFRNLFCFKFNPEFDKFLQERAAVGDTLPTANVGSHSNVTAPASNPQNRQMQMTETENSMFAL